MLKNKSNLIKILAVLLILILVNVIGNHLYKRFDLTQDPRYTLSDSALNTIKDVQSPLIIDVFLDGDFPSEYRIWNMRLQKDSRNWSRQKAKKSLF